ncbi:Maf family protein [Homoserinimonas sp. A447]
MRLYLASTSPARLATLRAAGVEPAGLISPGVDEEAAVASLAAGLGRPLTASETVYELARLKAEAVVGQLVDGSAIDGFILGGDSAFELDGTVYGKPHTAAVARERWQRMVGRTGVLHSGHWVIDHRAGSVHSGIACAGIGAVEDASVEFAADVTAAEIDAYIGTGEPLSVAGAFTVDSRGQAFIRRIDGNPSTVIGLSIPTLRSLLRDGFGVGWHELWNR